MFRPLVSVMIPFYNSRETLGKCLDSVVAQTYRPLEILLVDDCGIDDSRRIADQFLKNNKDSDLTIRIITHSENRGLAAARISAIEAAYGEYFAAVDSDDYVDADAIEEYVKATDNGRFDIVAAGVRYEYPNKSKDWLYVPGENFALSEVTINAMHFLFTNKLMRTSALRSIQAFVPRQDYWEDLGALVRLLASGVSTTILNRCYYHYVQYNAGAMTKGNQDKVLKQHIDVAKSIEDWMYKNGYYADNEQFMLYLKFIAKVKYLRNFSEVKRHPVRRLRAWRDTFPEVNTHIMSFRKVPIRFRLLFKAAFFVSRLLSDKPVTE